MTEIQTIRFHREVGEDQGEQGGRPSSDAMSATPRVDNTGGQKHLVQGLHVCSSQGIRRR